MLNVSTLNQFLEAQLPAALEMLRHMVGINSFSLNRHGLQQLGRFTAECFAPLGYRKGQLPESENAADETLALPIYPELSDAQAAYVVDVVRDFILGARVGALMAANT